MERSYRIGGGLRSFGEWVDEGWLGIKVMCLEGEYIWGRG